MKHEKTPGCQIPDINGSKCVQLTMGNAPLCSDQNAEPWAACRLLPDALITCSISEPDPDTCLAHTSFNIGGFPQKCVHWCFPRNVYVDVNHLAKKAIICTQVTQMMDYVPPTKMILPYTVNKTPCHPKPCCKPTTGPLS